MAKITYGVGNSIEVPIADTAEITSAHKQILGVPENAILTVNGQEGYTGPLNEGSVVTFVTRSNSKAS